MQSTQDVATNHEYRNIPIATLVESATEKLQKVVAQDLVLKRNKRKTSVAKKTKAKTVTA